MKQYIFQKDYTEDLYKKVKQKDFTAYHADKFDYNEDATFSIEIER